MPIKKAAKKKAVKKVVKKLPAKKVVKKVAKKVAKPVAKKTVKQADVITDVDKYKFKVGEYILFGAQNWLWKGVITAVNKDFSQGKDASFSVRYYQPTGNRTETGHGIRPKYYNKFAVISKDVFDALPQNQQAGGGEGKPVGKIAGWTVSLRNNNILAFGCGNEQMTVSVLEDHLRVIKRWKDNTPSPEEVLNKLMSRRGIGRYQTYGEIPAIEKVLENVKKSTENKPAPILTIEGVINFLKSK